MVMTASVQKRSNLADLKKRIHEVAKINVLVGIPQEKDSREEGGSIGNAELLYIHTHGIRKRAMREEMKSDMDEGKKYSEAYSLYVQSHGSPLWHSPPRPVLEPAIEANKESMAEVLKAAVLSYIHSGSEFGFRRAGMLGASAAKNWFQDPRNGWEPNSPKTIARKGSSLPLVDTGALRQAITYVIRKGD